MLDTKKTNIFNPPIVIFFRLLLLRMSLVYAVRFEGRPALRNFNSHNDNFICVVVVCCYFTENNFCIKTNLNIDHVDSISFII